MKREVSSVKMAAIEPRNGMMNCECMRDGSLQTAILDSLVYIEWVKPEIDNRKNKASSHLVSFFSQELKNHIWDECLGAS